MSLSDYQDFVYSFGKLNDPDPVTSWMEESKRMNELASYLDDMDEIIFEGNDIDLRLSIKGRRIEVADGKVNFPDGEIFTGPVEDSVSGWVQFKYPAIYGGCEVRDIKLWFEKGRVVKYEASKGHEFLGQILDTDSGSRTLGEWGIGTNYSMSTFTKNMLFDEKLGGTIHFALGNSYPETGGKNESGIHWDMLCDMSQGEIRADGELFYRDGKPLMWD
jgi:aminopeptidase